MNTSLDIKSTSSPALREFDVAQPHSGAAQMRREADPSSVNAEVLHVSPSAQQRNLDEIMRCLCAPEGGSA